MKLRITIECCDSQSTRSVTVLVIVDPTEIVKKLQKYETDKNGNLLVSEELTEYARTKAKALMPNFENYNIKQIEEVL
jgi:hypothetical protein